LAGLRIILPIRSQNSAEKIGGDRAGPLEHGPGRGYDVVIFVDHQNLFSVGDVQVGVDHLAAENPAAPRDEGDGGIRNHKPLSSWCYVLWQELSPLEILVELIGYEFFG